MRVDLAAEVSIYSKKNKYFNSLSFSQVLSASVSKALQLVVGEEAAETARFADYFNKYFDALNVSNFDEGKHSRNPFKAPY